MCHTHTTAHTQTRNIIASLLNRRKECAVCARACVCLCDAGTTRRTGTGGPATNPPQHHAACVTHIAIYLPSACEHTQAGVCLYAESVYQNIKCFDHHPPDIWRVCACVLLRYMLWSLDKHKITCDDDRTGEAAAAAAVVIHWRHAAGILYACRVCGCLCCESGRRCGRGVAARFMSCELVNKRARHGGGLLLPPLPVDISARIDI